MPDEPHRLIAEVEDGKLSITVESGGQEYENIESAIDILLRNQQFVGSFERPILTLLTLYNREQEERVESQAGDDGEFSNTEIEDLPS